MINFTPIILSKLHEESIHFKYLQVDVLAHDFNLALNAVIAEKDYLYYMYLMYCFLDCDLNDLKSNALGIYYDLCPEFTDIHIDHDFQIANATIESCNSSFLPTMPSVIIRHLTIVDSDFKTILGLPNVEGLSLYDNPYLISINRLPYGLKLLEVVNSRNLIKLTSIPSTVSQLSLVDNENLNFVQGSFKYLESLTVCGNCALSRVDFSDCEYVKLSNVDEFESKLIKDLLT